MKKIKLTKIPSVVRRLNLSRDVMVKEHVEPEEGGVIVAQVLDENNTINEFDDLHTRAGRLVEGDIIPGALGIRRALHEFSGDVPAQIRVGDTLYMLCESAVLGTIRGINEYYGQPLGVRVLGSLIYAGKPANIRDVGLPWQSQLDTSAPIVAAVGTSMESGKTTAISKLIKYFAHKGLNVVFVKLTGVSHTRDRRQAQDYGACYTLDFVDGGLPSSCGHPDNVLQAALGILAEANRHAPDLIVAEFGDSIFGEYNVDYLLQSPDIKRHIRATIVVINDMVAAWGARELMRQYGLPITAITGPAVNNESGVVFVEANLGVTAETNLYDMPKTKRLVEECVFGE